MNRTAHSSKKSASRSVYALITLGALALLAGCASYSVEIKSGKNDDIRVIALKKLELASAAPQKTLNLKFRNLTAYNTDLGERLKKELQGRGYTLVDVGENAAYEMEVVVRINGETQAIEKQYAMRPTNAGRLAGDTAAQLAGATLSTQIAAGIIGSITADQAAKSASDPLYGMIVDVTVVVRNGADEMKQVTSITASTENKDVEARNVRARMEEEITQAIAKML